MFVLVSMSSGRQEAFEIFKRDYRENHIIDENKRGLRNRLVIFLIIHILTVSHVALCGGRYLIGTKILGIRNRKERER